MENKNKKNEIILCKTCSHELMYSDFSINMKENEDFEIFKSKNLLTNCLLPHLLFEKQINY